MKIPIIIIFIVWGLFTPVTFAGERIVSEDIVVMQYFPTELMQGQSNAKPIFRLKNVGGKLYKKISVNTHYPKGRFRGEEVALKESGKYRTVTLAPGEEVDYFPGYSLSAKPDQPKIDYSMSYSITFSDEDGHTYLTPKYKIKSYAQVVGGGETANISNYIQKDHGAKGRKKPHKVTSDSISNITEFLSRLKNEVAKLEKVVHPSQLTGLKELVFQMEQRATIQPNSTTSIVTPSVTESHTSLQTSDSSVDQKKKKFQDSAIQYSLDMMNPLKTSKDIHESFDELKKATEERFQ